MQSLSRNKQKIEANSVALLLMAFSFFTILMGFTWPILYRLGFVFLIVSGLVLFLEYRNLKSLSCEELNIDLPKRLYLFQDYSAGIYLTLEGREKALKQIDIDFFSSNVFEAKSIKNQENKQAIKNVNVSSLGMFEYESGFLLQAKKIGRHALPNCIVSIECGLKFFRKKIYFQCKDLIDVFPGKQHSSDYFIQKNLSLDSANMATFQKRSLFASELVSGIREYFPGDAIKHASAKQTARLQKPMVKTFEYSEKPKLSLVLDTGRSMTGLVDGSDKLDFYLALAAHLSEYCVSMQGTYSFSRFNQNTVEMIKNSNKATAMLDMFRSQHSLLKPSGYESSYERLFVWLKKNMYPQSVFVFSDVMQKSNQDKILQSMHLIPHRHRVIFINLIEAAFDIKQVLKNFDTSKDDLAKCAYPIMLEQDKQTFKLKLQRQSNVSFVNLDPRHAIDSLSYLFRQI